MRRARKSGFSAKRAHQRKEFEADERVFSVEETPEIDINDDDKKDFQLKYYGKILDEDSVSSESPDVIENKGENLQGENDIENDPDADMKIVKKDENNVKYSVTKSSLESNTPVFHTKNKKKKPNKKRILIFAISLFVIIVASVTAISLGGFFDTMPLFDPDSISGEYITSVDEVTGKVNVLILGVDNEGLRTDTIIVASYDTDDKKLDMLSIPRDTRMWVGSRYQKINAAHAISNKSGKIKGPQGTVEAVTRLTGIPINFYVEFSFKAFRDTIDALDGVYFDVPQNMYYQDPYQDLDINLKKGYQLLNGDKAEQLVRFRMYPEGDIKRVQVQQDFITALTEQKLNIGIVAKIPEIYQSLSKNIKTNFTIGDMTKYAQSLLKLESENITMHKLPGRYSENGEYSGSYWLCDMIKTRELVNEVFGYDTSKTTLGKAGSKIIKYTDIGSVKSSESSDNSSKKNTTSKNNDEDEGDEKYTSSKNDSSKTDKNNKDKNNKNNNTDSNNDKSSEESSNTSGVLRPEKNTDDDSDKAETSKSDKEDKPEDVPAVQIPDSSGDDLSENTGFVRPGANE